MTLRNYVRYTLTALIFILSLVFSNKALATDFSQNPFADSESRLLRSRGQAALINIGGNSVNSGVLNNYQIGNFSSGMAVDDTTSNTNLFSTPLSYGLPTPYAFSPYRGSFWGRGYGSIRDGYRGFGGFGVNPAMLGVTSSFSGAPFAGGFYGSPGLGFGRLGFGGFRGYGLGGLGGYRGYGFGRLFNPAGAALTMGAFGNWADNNELGEMGYNGPVVQGPPSKSSGNYYAPSTPDPTASGNYYSTNGPSMKMPIKPYTSPKNYWGSSGSPLPKDINKVPW